MARFKCEYCHDREYYAVIPDIFPEGRPGLADYAGDLKEWNDKWHKYWVSPEFQKAIQKLPKYCHNYLSDQADYVKTGLYPCPECYFDDPQ